MSRNVVQKFASRLAATAGEHSPLSLSVFMKKLAHWRIILVIIAMMTVFSATYYKWTALLHSYGNYGSYIKQDGDKGLGGKFLLQFLKEDATSFEVETIYREAIKYQYWVAFWKIWTFAAFVFGSTVLILLAFPKKEK